jgi:hypothetical protein
MAFYLFFCQPAYRSQAACFPTNYLKPAFTALHQVNFELFTLSLSFFSNLPTIYLNFYTFFATTCSGSLEKSRWNMEFTTLDKQTCFPYIGRSSFFESNLNLSCFTLLDVQESGKFVLLFLSWLLYE